MEPTNQGKAGKEVAKLSQVIQIDEGKIQAHLGEMVRRTLEETFNAMLDAEADRLCRAGHCETHGSAEGHASRFLSAAVADESRRSDTEGSEVAHPAV